VNFFLQCVPSGLLAVLLLLMLRNRAYKVCPWFFVYVAFGVAADSARIAVHSHSRPFFAIYWITEAGYDVLGILVMYELLRMVLIGLARRWYGRLIFPAALVVGISLSVAHARAVPPRFSGLLLYIVVGEIAVRYVQVLIFIALGALAALALRSGLSWRRYSIGIAAGFGVYSSVALLITTKFWDIGIRFKFFWGWTLIAAYSLAVLIWIGFFRVRQEDEVLPALERADASDAPRKYPGRLDRVRHPALRIGAGL
jgi:hypothetical protein